MPPRLGHLEFDAERIPDDAWLNPPVQRLIRRGPKRGEPIVAQEHS